MNILNFKKLVTQRIALLMYKYHKGIVPDPINNLFSTNNNRHNYHTRQTNDLQTNTEKGKMFINFSVFTVSVFGTTSKKNQIDVSYACFENLSKTYLLNNEIPQRIRKFIMILFKQFLTGIISFMSIVIHLHDYYHNNIPLYDRL